MPFFSFTLYVVLEFKNVNKLFTNTARMSARKKQKLENDGPVLNQQISLPENIKLIQNFWKPKATPSVVTLVDGIVDVIQYPFPVCIVRNPIPTSLIKAALSEIPDIKFYEKGNDLYQFKQTADVANMDENVGIHNLYNVFKYEVKDWVEKTFAKDVNLKSDIAATFSCYEFTDRLLCHDDKCEDRHMAFVLYLTHDWTAEDGGNLDLFSTDDNGNPKDVVHSIHAFFNNLVLFEVTPTSFHQVSEVISQSKKRLSLNGWFHAKKCANFLEERQTDSGCTLLTSQPSATEFNLEDFFLVNYLEFKNQLDIKSMFVANSEIQLDEFVLPSTWNKICLELASSNIVWRKVGPANIRNYETAEHSSLPSVLLELYSLFQSRTWFRFLKTVTGVDVIPSSNSDVSAWQQGKQPTCRIEIQRWMPGTYTLVHDRDNEFHTPGLDTFLRFPLGDTVPPASDEDTPEAGHIVYIDSQAQDEECLLHLGQKMNSLGMIYRDLQTLRFTKYLDTTASPFYQIQGLYIPWAPPAEQPFLKHVEGESESEPSDVASEGDFVDDSEDEDVEDIGDESPITEESDSGAGPEPKPGHS